MAAAAAAVCSWLSPGTAWFIFFNLVVGAIVLISRSRPRGPRAAAAAIDRLRSFSLFSCPSFGDYIDMPPHPIPQERVVVPAEEEEKEKERCEEEEEVNGGGGGGDSTMSLEEAYVLARGGEAEAKRGRRRGVLGLGEELFGNKEEVNARAEEFIGRFREQLRLQRLNSILRYRNLAAT